MQSSLITKQDIEALASMAVIPDDDNEEYGNPPKAFQERFVGISFTDAYEQGSRFLNYVTEHCPLHAGDRVLDFGCGWGRMLKLLRFKGELDGVELHGCDVLEAAIDVVKRTVPRAWVVPTDTWPPSRYANDTFNLVYAFSVFSHLREDAHLQWAAEFARITRPGGLVVITLQGKAFLEMCSEFQNGTRSITHPWHSKLAKSFIEEDVLERFENGEFQFSDSRPEGFDPSYGEAVVPRKYIETQWKEFGFEIIDWNEAHGQNWCVLRLLC